MINGDVYNVAALKKADSAESFESDFDTDIVLLHYDDRVISALDDLTQSSLLRFWIHTRKISRRRVTA